MRSKSHSAQFVLLFLSFAALGNQQKVKDDSALDGLRINEQAYSTRVVQLLHQANQQVQPDMTLAQTVEQLVDHHLLAKSAQAKFSEEVLLSRHSRVGYSDDEQIAEQVSALFARLYNQDMQRWLAQQNITRVTDFITSREKCETENLKNTMALNGRQEFQLSEVELQKLNAQAVMQYKFPSAKQKVINLAELYRRQNVQGRISLHSGDCQFLYAQAERYLGQEFLTYWVVNYSGLTVSEVQQVQTAIQEHYLKNRYMALLGLTIDAHEDPEYLRERAKHIDAADIAQFYQKNREQFKRVSKARGQYFSMDNEKQADEVYQALNNGLSFAQAKKTFGKTTERTESSVPESNTRWVMNDGMPMSWRDTLFLVLPVAQVNRPVKAPSEQAWYFVWVDERVEEFQPADSESVRYQAAHSLARIAIAQELQQSWQQLKAHADIQYGANLMQAAQPL